MPVPVTIGDRIREARKAANLSKPQLGAVLGVHEQTIWRMESGKTKRIDKEQLEAIALATNESYEWLLTGNREKAADEWPDVYKAWLRTPEGKAANEKERAWVKTYRSNFEPTPAILSQHLSRERALRPEQFRDE